MKSYEEVLGRAQHYVNAELERRLEEATKRIPMGCVHNHRQPTDIRKEVYGEPNPTYNLIVGTKETIGLCMLGADNPEEWSGNICEDPIDAQRCPYFEAKQTKEDVVQGLVRDLGNSDWLVENMPALANLLWVLEESAPPRVPFWRRFLLKFKRIRVEPVRPPLKLDLLLPPSDDLRP